MPNLPRVMLRAPLRVVAWMLLVLVELAAPDVAPLPAIPGATILAWATPIATAVAVNGISSKTAPVGSFKPNALGLYDMHGNVWEWVEDSWHETYDGAPTDGSAWLRGGDPSYRVVRGGSWRNESQLVRAAVRKERNTNVRFDTLGFRVARTIRPSSSSLPFWSMAEPSLSSGRTASS